MTVKKKTKIIPIVLSFLIIVIFALIIFVYLNLKPTVAYKNGELNNPNDEYVNFTINNGDSVKTVINNLKEEGIIKNSTLVYYYNRFIVHDEFYSGKYKLPLFSNVKDILDYLSNVSNAKDDVVTIRLSDGDFLKSYAQIIATNININEDDLINAWNLEDYVRSLMSDYPFLSEDIFNEDNKCLLEGYLLPDTYEFAIESDVDKITRVILDNTLKFYNDNLNLFNNSKLTIHQIFTLASIVEWESGDIKDSSKVAGVFVNRLNNEDNFENINTLDSTVTACYAFDLNKEDCYTYGDLEKYTSKKDVYNTYTTPGLPPGPVCNPSIISLKAALTPDCKDGYYYFIGDLCFGSGTIFAKNYKEHQANIEKYIKCKGQ